MSAHFRQRTPGEYARILWRRKWLILLPTLAIASAVTWVVMRLPDIYESSTLIVVKPSTIPSAVVPAASEDMLTRQLTTISQVVTSRSSLQPLVEKYRLYEAERASGEAMESVIDRMRKDIKVELNTTRNDITNGFNITYRGRDPRTTQVVTAELASKYINAQAKNASDQGKLTKEFFEQQIAKVKEELDAIAQKRLDFMRTNLENLPAGQEPLGIQLTGLYEQQKAYITDIGRMRDSLNLQNQRLSDLEKQRQQEIDNIIEIGNDPKQAPEYTKLADREAALVAEYNEMKPGLTDKNPDLKKKLQEIDAVREQMQRAVEEGKVRAAEKRKRYEDQMDPRINSVKYDIEFTKGEISRQQRMLDQTTAEIGSLQSRINAIPGVQVGLETLDREYKTKQESYDSLLAQQLKANTISEISSSQQGESIAVVDAANLPERPVAPKRTTLILMGLLLGLCAGLGLAAAFEVPRLLTIQTTDDAEHYTGLPVLVTVPELMTPQEARAVPRRRLMLLAAGIVVAVASVPAIAYALKLTRILDRLVS